MPVERERDERREKRERLEIVDGDSRESERERERGGKREGLEVVE